MNCSLAPYLWLNFTAILSLNLFPLQSETSLSWFEETPRDNTQDEQTEGADGELDMEIQGARVPEIKDKQSVLDYIFCNTYLPLVLYLRNKDRNDKRSQSLLSTVKTQINRYTMSLGLPGPFSSPVRVNLLLLKLVTRISNRFCSCIVYKHNHRSPGPYYSLIST